MQRWTLALLFLFIAIFLSNVSATTQRTFEFDVEANVSAFEVNYNTNNVTLNFTRAVVHGNPWTHEPANIFIESGKTMKISKVLITDASQTLGSEAFKFEYEQVNKIEINSKSLLDLYVPFGIFLTSNPELIALTSSAARLTFVNSTNTQVHLGSGEHTFRIVTYDARIEIDGKEVQELTDKAIRASVTIISTTTNALYLNGHLFIETDEWGTFDFRSYLNPINIFLNNTKGMISTEKPRINLELSGADDIYMETLEGDITITKAVGNRFDIEGYGYVDKILLNDETIAKILNEEKIIVNESDGFNPLEPGPWFFVFVSVGFGMLGTIFLKRRDKQRNVQHSRYLMEVFKQKVSDDTVAIFGFGRSYHIRDPTEEFPDIINEHLKSYKNETKLTFDLRILIDRYNKDFDFIEEQVIQQIKDSIRQAGITIPEYKDSNDTGRWYEPKDLFSYMLNSINSMSPFNVTAEGSHYRIDNAAFSNDRIELEVMAEVLNKVHSLRKRCITDTLHRKVCIENNVKEFKAVIREIFEDRVKSGIPVKGSCRICKRSSFIDYFK